MKIEDLELAIQQREEEVSGYQTNIDNYARMIAELPSTWPQGLTQYKGREISGIVGDIEEESDLTLVADLLFHDKLQITLRSEKLEQRKAVLILKILKDQV